MITVTVIEVLNFYFCMLNSSHVQFSIISNYPNILLNNVTSRILYVYYGFF